MSSVSEIFGLLNSAYVQFILAIAGTKIPKQNVISNDDVSALIEVFWNGCNLSEPIPLNSMFREFIKYFDFVSICQHKNFNPIDLYKYLNREIQLVQGDLQFLKHLFEFVSVDYLQKLGENGGVLIRSATNLPNLNPEGILALTEAQSQDYYCTNFKELLQKVTQRLQYKRSDQFMRLVQLSTKQLINEIPIQLRIYQQALQNEQQLCPGVLSAPVIADLILSQSTLPKQMFPIQKLALNQQTDSQLYQLMYRQAESPKQVPSSLISKIQDGTMIFKQCSLIEPSSLCERSANGAPFVIIKLMCREVSKIINQLLGSMNNIQKIKQIAKLMPSFYTQIMEQFTKDLQEFNPLLIKNQEKDIKILILQASNADAESFVYQESQDHMFFVSQTVQKTISIAMNFGFMCSQECDRQISAVTGAICPFGGFGCRLTLQYLKQMQNFWQNQHEQMAVVFASAIKILQELISAKAGSKLIKEKRPNKFSFLAKLVEFTPSELTLQIKELIDVYQVMQNCGQQAEQQLQQQLLLLKNFNQITIKAFAAAEYLQFNDQKHSAAVNSLLLSPEFLQFCSQKQNSPKLKKLNIISMQKAGGSSLLQQLCMHPLFRFSTLTESLAKEPIQFSPGSLAQIDDCWKLLSFQQEDFSVKMQKKADTDAMSTGSWLSMDSQNLQQEKKEVDHTARANISSFISLKPLQETDLQLEQQKELQLQNALKVEYINFNQQTQLQFADFLAQVPKEVLNQPRLQSTILDQHGQQSIEEEILQKQFQQAKNKKQAPMISFSQLKPPTTIEQLSYSIPLLGQCSLEVLDTPVKYLGFIDSQNAILKTQLENEIQKMQEQQNQITQQNADKQKQLVGYIQQLFVLFQKQLLAAQLRQEQQSAVSQVVHPKTRQLQPEALQNLIVLVQKQLLFYQQEVQQCKQEMISTSTTFENMKLNNQVTEDIQKQFQGYVAQKKGQMEKGVEYYQQLSQEQTLLMQIQDCSKQQQIIQLQLNQQSQKLIMQTEQLKSMHIQGEVIQLHLQQLKDQICLVVYDCTQWIDLKQLLLKVLEGQKIIFVCNKCDLLGKYGNLQVIDTVLSFCTKFNMEHYFVSAKTGLGIDLLRLKICQEIGECCHNWEGEVYK